MPFKTANTNDQFIGEFIEFNLPLGNKGKRHSHSVIAVLFDEVVRFALKEPFEGIAMTIYVICKGLKALVP